MSILSINPVRGPWVAATGRPCHVTQPDYRIFEDVERVGFALSNVNRYSGNYGPYSVAQHAVLVSWVAEQLGATPRQKLAALHHDDSEIIIGDVPAPVKSVCPALKEIERLIHQAVNIAHQVDVEDELVKEADYNMYLIEVENLIPPEDHWMFLKQNDDDEWERIDPARFRFHERIFPGLWPAPKAQAAYINRHEVLFQDCLIEMGVRQNGAEA